MALSNVARETRLMRQRQLFCALGAITLLIGAAVAAVKILQVRHEAAIVTELSPHATIYFNHQHDAITGRRGGGASWTVLAKAAKASPYGPAWLRRVAGDGYFRHVSAVTVPSNPDDLRPLLPLLKQLPHLKEVFLYAPSCGFSMPSYADCKQLLQAELPHVTISDTYSDIVG